MLIFHVDTYSFLDKIVRFLMAQAAYSDWISAQCFLCLSRAISVSFASNSCFCLTPPASSVLHPEASVFCQVHIAVSRERNHCAQSPADESFYKA